MNAGCAGKTAGKTVRSLENLRCT